MKIILSHDIDHLYWYEHYFKDLYLPGTLLRNTKGFVAGKLELQLYLKRLKCWGRIHRIPELIKYFNQENIKSNFFFGMDNALHLSYNYKQTKPFIQELLKEGHLVGVHGIAFKEKNQIEIENKRFKELSNINPYGIRTHYLRLSGYSHNLFDQQGYKFDSSIDSIMHPFRINNMWEIPISIMDASLVEHAQLNQDINIWKKNTLKRLEIAKENNLAYFVINFHDTYFSDAFPVIKEWFLWLVDSLKGEKYEFITFNQAVEELNSNFNLYLK